MKEKEPTKNQQLPTTTNNNNERVILKQFSPENFSIANSHQYIVNEAAVSKNVSYLVQHS